MIRFDSITYKNILSVGQAPITLSLSSNRLTALHGPSGSGKSLFLDALSFALFGRAFRDINKTELINTINGKGLLVEVAFTIGKDTYMVSRGLKPQVFQIEVNGTPLNQESHSKDQQKFLEDQILKMNWKMFTHVVMLGAANYTPFMRLKPSERKKMVENILGIDVFSTMNGVVKSKISDESLHYKAIVEKREMLGHQVAYLERQQAEFEEKVKDEIKALTQKLISLRDKKKLTDSKISKNEHELERLVASFNPEVIIPEFTETFTETFLDVFDEEFSETFEERSATEFDSTELVTLRGAQLADAKLLNSQIEQAQEQLDFLKENDTCQTCSQCIDQDFKARLTAELTGQVNIKRAAIADAKIEIQSIESQIRELEQAKVSYREALAGHSQRKADFEGRKEAFEQRRRKFEERRRAFEARRRTHEERLREVSLLVDEKKAEFERSLTGRRKDIEDCKSSLTALLTEAKLIKESIEERKSSPILDNGPEILRLKADIETLEIEVNKSAKRIKLLREAQAVIKDDGVKAEILKRYVPTLNKYINQYLSKMGLFVCFELDSEFNDTIRSRHRDVLSYANYSEGERQRLDLAVLLAWRHLAQAQSAVNTNLLVLDEVLDSYLDQGTTETILGLLKGDEFQAFNIFIISHKEGLSESFDQTLHFQKKNNFTSVSLRG
jgi:DNA repair exonuclease SbcCD ATPase subunit